MNNGIGRNIENRTEFSPVVHGRKRRRITKPPVQSIKLIPTPALIERDVIQKCQQKQ